MLLQLVLNKDTFGETVDFHGGIKDLKAGLLRILHDESFMDDPTRILRGIRFKEDLNFLLSCKTILF